ncbi:Pex14p [Candida albicans SC5314]|uniref:Peroxisomal membrane protein PEX14 n=1 Tax=Candida albicans (strain SC5314 / ATCC MYA-2876) TaxID=237561 RepID=A0A1D8PSW1_CANAL|nr:Pex14p [Candida albicans SC5314]AOW31226.1 Pex14p [Candida albicans SC5314]|eukprot:XP_710192.2 Pex14p [Candida albicans SC5314]
MNEELINSAVSFLKDPQVGGSPLTKKVEFLESKGLNQEEIEEALKRANDNSTTTSSSSSSVASSNSSNTTSSPSYQLQQQQQQQVYSQPPIDYYNVVPPPVPEKSWKDYFIMATATAGVTYGLYQVVTRYLIPSIIPPSQSSIDKDKETINEEFMKIDKILDQLTFEQEEIKHANETKLSEIDTVIENVNDFLNKYNKDKLKFDDDLRLMKLEIDNLNNSIEKNMHLTKENINDELGEISQELQSLKNLIKARSGSNNNQTNGGNGGGIEARKIAPVSSIPSASEILKKARAKNAASTTPEPKQEPVKSEDTKSEETKSKETKSEETKRSEGITKNGVMAAGIPSWQLQHKEKEAQKKSNQEQTSNNNNNNNNNSSGIPVWQQAAAAAATTSSVDTSKSEEEIKEKIKSVGVPAWQLNASTSSGSGSYNNNNINGNDNSKNGPQQQQSSSAE